MVTEVLTSPFPRAGGWKGPPVAAEAWPLPGFVGSGVAGTSSNAASRSQGIGDGTQYYPLSPRGRRAQSLSASSGAVVEASRWLHSPSSLEASYAGLGRRAPVRTARGSTPPATPPAHRVGSLREGLTRSELARYGCPLEADPCRAVQADAAKISGIVSNTAQRDWPSTAGWERVSVDEEKKELLRCLEASNQRNQELELERQGLKNSLERMEKLLVDLVGTQQAAHVAHSVQSDAGRTYAAWTPSVTPRRIPAELNRGASPLRHFSLSILDKSQPAWQDCNSFTRDLSEHFGRSRRSSPLRRPWSPPRGYNTPMSEALPTPPKWRAPMVHSGYGLVTEPITAAADNVVLENARGVPRSLATSQSWMCRDRYNLVDICQNLPPRLKRW